MKYKQYRGFLQAVLLSAALGIMGCGGSQTQKPKQETGEKISVENALEVHFLDVGQGDCTLIKAGNHAMLIDAGENEKGQEVKEYLEYQGVEKLDYIVGTHPDSDHIGGMDVVMRAFDSEHVFMPEVEKDTITYQEVIETAKNKKETITCPEVGEEFALGDASFTIVAPNEDHYRSANDYSIGILLEHGENSFLFVGDAEEQSEEEMLKNKISLDADVYKVSHHGSKTGTSEEFLNEVSPEVAVISCGEGNSYGHPHAEVLNELRSEKVKMYRTDDQGTIVATSDGEKIQWNMSSSDNWTPGESKGSASSTTSKPVATTGKGQTYILNTNSMKYHRPSCNSIKTIKKKNREERKTTEKALQKEGYSACKNCIGR